MRRHTFQSDIYPTHPLRLAHGADSNTAFSAPPPGSTATNSGPSRAPTPHHFIERTSDPSLMAHSRRLPTCRHAALFFSPLPRRFYAARCVFNRVSPFPPAHRRHILVRIPPPFISSPGPSCSGAQPSTALARSAAQEILPLPLSFAALLFNLWRPSTPSRPPPPPPRLARRRPRPVLFPAQVRRVQEHGPRRRSLVPLRKQYFPSLFHLQRC